MRLIRLLARRSALERRLLVEALLLLPAAAFQIRRRTFGKTVGFGAIPLGARPTVPLDSLLWAVRAAARRMPFRALCFEQGLTVQRMLRRRGAPAVLHYGIASGDTLEAHVWVSLDDRIVQGGEGAESFREVGCWP